MADEDLLTVQEAAEALSVSAPRLRRLLARPEWSQRTETRTRQTRTGTRTATVLNRSLLPELREALETSAAPSSTIEQERERDATGTGTDRNENENAPDWKTRALIAESERDGLTARLADTASDRDAWKAQAQSLTEALQRAQDEARAARALSSRSAMQIEAAPTPSGDSSPVSSGGVIPSPPSQAERPWWRFWKGKS